MTLSLIQAKREKKTKEPKAKEKEKEHVFELQPPLATTEQ